MDEKTNSEWNHGSCFLKFWGTRGSCAVAGEKYDGAGGNTSCLEMQYDDSPLLIIDAGSGIRALGLEVLTSKYTEIHIILSHFHWDHILGFPFFLPLYQNKYKIHIYGPGQSSEYVKQQFETLLKKEFFPISLGEFMASITFHTLTLQAPIEVGKMKVYSCRAQHPGDTYCFKIKTPTSSVGYATDNEFLFAYHGPAAEFPLALLVDNYKQQVEFFTGCDLMIHEAQYLPEMYMKKVGWGHSSITNALILMKFVNPKEWIITHHDPEDSDACLSIKKERVKALLKGAELDCNIEIAAEGMQRPL